MESEFGPFFLSNFRLAPLAASISDAEIAKPGKPESQAPPLPPLVRQFESTESTTPGSSGLFRLAAPPPNQFAVGSRTPAEQVVKIETLQEQKAAPTRSKAEEGEEDYGPTGAVFVNDEESLLGAGAPAAVAPGRLVREVDSEGEEEAAPVQQYKVQVTVPEQVELPPPRPLELQKEAEPVVVPEEEAFVEPPPVPVQDRGENRLKLAKNLASAQSSPAATPGLSAPAPTPARAAGESLASPALTVPAPTPTGIPGQSLSPSPALKAVLPTPAQASVPTAALATATTSPAKSLPIIPGQVQSFRIVVPQPFPGVQIRKSPNLDDKHDRFLQDGKFVTGKVDTSGQWVKLSNKHYLPVQVGQIQVLHVVDPQDVPSSPGRPETDSIAKEEEANFWWTCCAGPAVTATIQTNDLHVAPQERNNVEDSGWPSEGAMLTPMVVAQGKPEAESSGGAAQKAAKLFPGEVAQLPRHISNPIDPFSDR
ncbi:unnamed protein product [Effrenium voratum]|uniref:Uncharacterized protein n=1 Tax=Effrenium voratum TaxID=2562239 RepID=A0AA36MKX5_9DINO|nr:unnamed protein product [Effrenium voratum]